MATNLMDMLERVEDLVDREEFSEASVYLAEAIGYFPDDIEAHLLMGLSQTNDAARVGWLWRAKRLGDAEFAAAISEAPDGRLDFWGSIETRPYMRAVYMLAQSLWSDASESDRSEAMDLLLFLLRICPNDNMGVRYIALEWLCRSERWPEALDLRRRYDSEKSPELLMWEALCRFQRGESKVAAGLILQAQTATPNMLDFMQSKKLRRPEANFVAVGSEDQAHAYAFKAQVVWSQVPGAMDFLRRF